MIYSTCVVVWCPGDWDLVEEEELRAFLLPQGTCPGVHKPVAGAGVNGWTLGTS